MFKYLNYFKKYIVYFYALYKFVNNKNNKYNDIYLQRLENAIYNCGPIGVKLIQYIVMYDGILPIKCVNKLNYTFENCKVHSWEDTQRLYYNNFGSHIEDDFDLDLYNDLGLVDDIHGYNSHVIGSGSIGQVYKLYHKKLGKYVAVKVRHPNIENDIQMFTKIIRSLINIASRFITVPYKNLILVFTDNIVIQKNFIKEAQNTIQMRNNFIEDNIIIPEVYTYHDDFIIMSYHKGVDINTVNNKLKYAINNDINFLVLSSVLIYDCIHADLHDGNIKVELLPNNKYNIIIYDCGLVISTQNLHFNRDTVMSLISGNYTLVLDSILNMHSIEQEKYNITLEFINKIIHNTNISSGERPINIIKYLLDNNIINNNAAINLLLSEVMTSPLHTTVTNKIQKIINMPSEVDACIIFYIYIGLLDRTKKFKKLKEYFIYYNNCDISYKEIFDKWMFTTFGHNDNDIIYDLVYKYFGYCVE